MSGRWSEDSASASPGQTARTLTATSLRHALPAAPQPLGAAYTMAAVTTFVQEYRTWHILPHLAVYLSDASFK